MNNSHINHYLILAAGVITVSFTTILIRMTATPAGPNVIGHTCLNWTTVRILN